MFGWFSNKDKPTFWKNYVLKFKDKQPTKLEEVRFVVFDTETTGLDTKTDRILSIGAIGLKGNVIDVSDSLEVYLEQDKFSTETVAIHGILKGGELSKVTEKEAIIKFIVFIENAVIVAHHTAFDIQMVNESLKRMGLPNLKNKTLDTGVLYKKLNNVPNKHFGLDELCQEFKVPMHDRHTASGDAYLTAIVFIKILARMRMERKVTFGDLFVNRNKRGLL